MFIISAQITLLNPLLAQVIPFTSRGCNLDPIYVRLRPKDVNGIHCASRAINSLSAIQAWHGFFQLSVEIKNALLLPYHDPEDLMPPAVVSIDEVDFRAGDGYRGRSLVSFYRWVFRRLISFSRPWWALTSSWNAWCFCISWWPLKNKWHARLKNFWILKQPKAITGKTYLYSYNSFSRLRLAGSSNHASAALRMSRSRTNGPRIVPSATIEFWHHHNMKGH